MFCAKCGQENQEQSKFCSGCGNALNAQPSTSSQSVIKSESTASESMTFGNAISTCFSKYADFNGRSSRAEYWWFYLFTVLISWGASIPDSSRTLAIVFSIGVMLPTSAAVARRLHDTNKSGWWQLIGLTIIGLIPLIIWLATEGSKEPNQYGNPV